MLEGAVEKTGQKDLLVNSNKPTLISRIEFVIPDKFKDVGNNFLFLVLIEVVEELV